MRAFQHRAAGHDGLLTEGEGALVFKPYHAKEAAFYMEVQRRRVDEPGAAQDVPLHLWMPCFMGVLEQGDVRKPGASGNTPAGSKYIVLNNLLHGYSRPNVMDIKLGSVLYDEDAPLEKRQRLQEVSRTTTSGSLAFRICGMKIERGKASCTALDEAHYDVETHHGVEYLSVNKFYGRTRTKDDISEAIELFFNNERLSKPRKKQLYDTFWQRLQLFYNTLLDTKARFISSSLLFVYESDPAAWEELDDVDELVHDYEVELIDTDEEDDELAGGFVQQTTQASMVIDTRDDDELPNPTIMNEKVEPRNKKLSSMTFIDFAHSQFTDTDDYDENVILGVENLIDIFNELRIWIWKCFLIDMIIDMISGISLACGQIYK